MSQQLRRHRQLFKRLLAVFLLAVAVNTTISAYLIFTNPDLPPYRFSVRLVLLGQKDPLSSIDQAPWTQVTSQVVSVLIWTYSTCTWILGFFAFVAQVLVLTHLQSAFNRSLASQTRECPSLSEDYASAYRLVYLKVVEIVGSANSMIRVYLCATMIFCLAAVMFMINAMLDSAASLSIPAVTIMAFWLASGIALLCISVGICGRVSNLSKKPLEVLHRQEVTSKNANAIAIFLHTVSHSDCGLSCAGFFTVEHSAIVSLAELFISYFILIVQTRPSATALGGSFNGTQRTTK